MTYNIKNMSFVFVFAAMLMAMPFATGTAFAETTTALIAGSCGYNVPSTLAFATITPGTTTTLSASFTDWSVVTDKNGSSRILVEGSEWVGLGDRAQAKITITQIDEDENVVVRGVTYLAKDTPVGATEFQSTTGATAIQSAESLASKIRANDSLLRLSTGGTNVVTIQAETAGNALTQNDYTFTSTGTTVTLDPSDNSFGGGALNVDTHLVAENTHYDITTDGSAADTTYATMSAFKTAVDAAVAPQEMIGGTDVNFPLKVNLAIKVDAGALINLPYEGTITQTLTFTITCDGT